MQYTVLKRLNGDCGLRSLVSSLWCGVGVSHISPFSSHLTTASPRMVTFSCTTFSGVFAQAVSALVPFWASSSLSTGMSPALAGSSLLVSSLPAFSIVIVVSSVPYFTAVRGAREGSSSYLPMHRLPHQNDKQLRRGPGRGGGRRAGGAACGRATADEGGAQATARSVVASEGDDRDSRRARQGEG